MLCVAGASVCFASLDYSFQASLITEARQALYKYVKHNI